MNTGCEFYADALVDLAAGRLEEERAERVAAHVATCPECQAALEVIRQVKESPAPVPPGLESRIQAAVRGDADPSTPVAPVRARPSPWRSWRPWALPLAVAAALAVWVGGSALLAPGGEAPVEAAGVETEYDPYGAWPGSDGVVAGDVVLSELSVEELEALLEEMES